MDTVKRLLPVMLTTEEFDAKAAELAAVTFDIEQIQADKKAAMSGFKAQLEGKAGLQKELASIVDKRSEYREVECEQRINGEHKVVEIVRTDTGEVVDTRSLTARDIQEALQFTDFREPKEGDGAQA